MAFYHGKEDTSLIIVYEDDSAIHRALGLAGAPISQGATPESSGKALRMFVFNQLIAGVPDKLVNCIEDAVRTVGPSTQYFPNALHRLPKRVYVKPRDIDHTYISHTPMAERACNPASVCQSQSRSVLDCLLLWRPKRVRLMLY